METFAIHKSAMVAPRKARMTLDLIRGKKAQEAQAILKNTNTKSSRLISKVLKKKTKSPEEKKTKTLVLLFQNIVKFCTELQEFETNSCNEKVSMI